MSNHRPNNLWERIGVPNLTSDELHVMSLDRRDFDVGRFVVYDWHEDAWLELDAPWRRVKLASNMTPEQANSVIRWLISYRDDMKG